MSEADHANARDWSKLLAPRCVGRALSPQAQEGSVESIFQKAMESLWQTNFQDPGEKKNAAQMLISLLDAVAGDPDISQNAPLCDKVKALKCVLETPPAGPPQRLRVHVRSSEGAHLPRLGRNVRRQGAARLPVPPLR